MRRWRPALALLLAAMIGSVPVAAQRKGAFRFEDGVAVLDPLPASALLPRLASDGGAWESWEYAFRFASGHAVLAQVQITNAGPGSHRGLVVAMVLAPDGRTALIKNGRPRDRWSWRRRGEGFELTLARHRMELSPARHRLHLENSQGAVDVEAEVEVPATRPGRVDYGDGRFYDLTLPAPRLRARGTLRWPGQAALDLGEGRGVAIRSVSNTTDYSQSDAWLRIHTFDGELEVTLVEMTTSRRYYRKKLGVLLVMEEGRTVLRTVEYYRRFMSVREDGERSGYPIPEEVLFWTTEGEGYPFQGRATLTLRRRDDLIEWLDSAIARWLVSRVSHPVQYTFDARCELTLELDGRRRVARGTGIASASVLHTPPPGERP